MSNRFLSYASIMLFLTLGAGSARAFSGGSPVCDVQSLPLLPMANAVSSPVPIGWSLRVDSAFYQAGSPVEVRIGNADPLKRVRGVLLWAKTSSDFQPAGSFLVGPGSMYQHVPPGNGVFCQQASITHIDASPRQQSTLVFSWSPPASGLDVQLRAFLIEDCALPFGCRGAQALTQTLLLSEAIFRAGFED